MTTMLAPLTAAGTVAGPGTGPGAALGAVLVPVLVPVLGAGLGAGAAGVLAGAATRRLLARLRRGAPVPAPWCEVATAAGWAAAGAAVAAGALPAGALPLLLVLCWLGVAGSAVDLACRRLPDALTLPALPAVLAALGVAGADPVLRGLGGAVLLAGAYAVVHLAAPRSLGAGDVKLALPVGAALAGPGWPVLVLGVLVAAVLGVVVAGGAVVTGAAGWRTRLPHGPVLLAAALVAVVLGAAGLDTGWSEPGMRR